MQETNAKIAAEAKDFAARHAQRSKQAAEQLKCSRAESAMKLLDQQSKMDQTIQNSISICNKIRFLLSMNED